MIHGSITIACFVEEVSRFLSAKICSVFPVSFFNSDNAEIDDNSTNVYDYSLTLINGEKLDIKIYQGKKIIIVNVASKCGYTPQYDGLQKLYDKYNDKIEVIGFPANDFLWQEPGQPIQNLPAYSAVEIPGAVFERIGEDSDYRNISLFPYECSLRS